MGKMNMNKLFQMQQALDERILREHNLFGKRLVDEKVLALLVEIGELANETRCFKFWSKKPPAAEEVILEEYVDGIHFILSLGLDLGITDLDIHAVKQEHSLIIQFNEVFEIVSSFRKDASVENYVSLFESYMTLGDMLGFSFAQMEDAYYKKNAVNHERQNQGY
jgi:dimeric dUTPase (all-alpha-NTP-PPase superfamily)